MSPADRRDEDVLVWPPPEEDLDAIEVLELSRPEPGPQAPPPDAATPPAGVAQPPDGPPSPVPDASLAGPPPPLAGPPPPASSHSPLPGASEPGRRRDEHPPPALPTQAVIEVLELDALGGAESYVVDIRAATSPALDQAGGLPPSEPDQRLEWPPREADLDAIEVLDLGPPGDGPGRGWPMPPALGVSPEPQGEPSRSAPSGLPAQGAPRLPGVPDDAPVAIVPVLVEERPPATPPPVAGDSPPSTVPTAERPVPWAWRDEPAPRDRTAARVLGWGLACAVLAGVVWVTVSRSGRTTSSPAGAPPGEADGGAGTAAVEASRGTVETPADAGGGADAVLAEARRAMAEGDRQRAVDLVEAYAARGGRDASALQFVESALRTVRSDVDRARRLAIARVGSGGSTAEMAAADRREAAAVAAWRAGEYGRALRGLIEAQRVFTRLQPGAGADVADAASPAPVAGGEATGALRQEPAATALPALPARQVALPSPLPAEATPVPGAPLTPTAPPRPLPAPPSVAAGTPPAPAGGITPSPTAEAAVRRALQDYRRAYEALDARAAAAVYPAVDQRALARAFSGLNSQTLEFERCDVTPLAGDRARAACVGHAAFVPKVGSQAPRVEARRWTFTLQREGDAWRIVQAQVSGR